jgi:hypothetical protein
MMADKCHENGREAIIWGIAATNPYAASNPEEGHPYELKSRPGRSVQPGQQPEHVHIMLSLYFT